MTLGALERHCKELREQGATDDSEVYVRYAENYSHVEFVEYDDVDDTVDIILE